MSNNINEINKVKVFSTKNSELVYIIDDANEGYQFAVTRSEILPNGDIKSLDQYSPIIKGLRTSSYKEIERIYYFED